MAIATSIAQPMYQGFFSFSLGVNIVDSWRLIHCFTLRLLQIVKISGDAFKYDNQNLIGKKTGEINTSRKISARMSLNE